MYNGKKVSVAMASYNGARYIQQQIDSICNQSIRPDEIIISDDGSSDNTIEIILGSANMYKPVGIDIRCLTDNPRKGYCGNFEWAITHTSGHYIFLSDQDDVWYENKIQTVLKVFDDHHDAECVIHECVLIDEKNNPLVGVFNRWTKQYILDSGVNTVFKINRAQYLDAAVSKPLANDMVICLSRESLKSSIPFPKCDGQHDAWLIFSAVCNDKCWYTPEVLGAYRLHGNNTCGNKVYQGNALERLKGIIKKMNISGVRSALTLCRIGESMIRSIELAGCTNLDAYKTAKRVFEIGSKEVCALSSARLSGAKQLYSLYKNDVRYRSIGKASFIYQLLRVLLYSKKKRISVLSL